MTYANTGWLETRPGMRQQVIDILTRPSPELVTAGCLLYEVGIDAEHPDRVLVVELWESAEAHRASLSHPSVQASIAEAMPSLTGEMGGGGFEVVGSPLR